ncbi:LCP family protein [Bacillus infantis]|uniref:LCP family protein n=1 Tax=Bacillus infantis TaxID=324767 RepID=UPI0021556297|nr:LCP family protein [Bacillus infantis]MCR6611605.1 LCP family protein [Bacillus infantis]
MKKLLFIICFTIPLTACSLPFDPGTDDAAPGIPGTSGEEETAYKQDAKGTTFLLIGIDSRGEAHSRSDAIMAASYMPKEKEIKLISLMRDSYVEIPGTGRHTKLNHAYYEGGKELLKETVEANFGLKIDYTAIIDFKGFIAAADLIAPDGLELEVSKEMIEDMKLDMQPGRQTLYGEELLSYVRFRHDGESDFGRVERQQEVLAALKNKLSERFGNIEGALDFPAVVLEAAKYIETDMEADEAIPLAVSYLLNSAENVQTLRIPVSDSYENKLVEKAGAVLEIDFEENKEAIKEFIGEKQ